MRAKSFDLGVFTSAYLSIELLYQRFGIISKGMMDLNLLVSTEIALMTCIFIDKHILLFKLVEILLEREGDLKEKG